MPTTRRRSTQFLFRKVKLSINAGAWRWIAANSKPIKLTTLPASSTKILRSSNKRRRRADPAADSKGCGTRVCFKKPDAYLRSDNSTPVRIGGLVGKEVQMDRGEDRVWITLGKSNVAKRDLDHCALIGTGLCRRTQIAPTNFDLRHVIIGANRALRHEMKLCSRATARKARRSSRWPRCIHGSCS
jgi:hypothetical protein